MFQSMKDNLFAVFDAVTEPKNIISLPRRTWEGISIVSKEFGEFLKFFKIYLQDKFFLFSTVFENNKNKVVKTILIKRGRRNRMFLHTATMAILTIGIIISPYISESHLLAPDKNALTPSQAQATEEQAVAPDDVFQTKSSVTIRNKVITYTVERGDTISTIAKKFDVSEDTIRWENNLTGDAITIGDTLQVLPVTGTLHKVQSGDTVYTIAKKYNVGAQNIVDFPFNDFANPQTFSLVTGQIVVVPDGVKPEEQVKPQYIRQQYIATGPATVTASGFTWPIRGTMNQYYSWYHPGIDLGASLGTPIVAAQSGRVAEAYTGGWNGGYGVHVIVSGDNGYSTLYSHMSATNVSSGQQVVAGQTVVGWVGLTGRTTGPHLHFEIRSSGGNLNPLSFLQ